ILFGWSALFSGMMRASGTVIMPMVLSLAAILCVELPGAIWLSGTSLGLQGIWWAYAASFSTMLVLQACWYQFVWRKKTIKALLWGGDRRRAQAILREAPAATALWRSS